MTDLPRIRTPSFEPSIIKHVSFNRHFLKGFGQSQLLVPFRLWNYYRSQQWWLFFPVKFASQDLVCISCEQYIVRIPDHLRVVGG